MARRHRHDGGRIHGRAGYPDHEFLAAGHLRRHRGDARRRLVDFHCLSDRRDRHHPADRLAGESIQHALVSGSERGALSRVLRGMRLFEDAGRDDHLPGGPGIYGRRIYSRGADRCHADAAFPEAIGSGDVWHDGDAGASDRAGNWGLADGPVWMGVELLHQYHSRRGDAFRGAVRRGAREDAAGRTEKRRLVGNPVHGDRAGLTDRDAGGGAAEGLVWQRFHRHLRRSRGDLRAGIRDHRAVPAGAPSSICG